MNTYSINGSDTTKSISRAPETVQTFWNLCNSYGVSIARVRKFENRFESTKGKTFKGTHYGKVSLYEQLKSPEKPLWFKRLLGIDTANPTMQILEVPEDFVINNDMLSAFRVVRMERSNNTGLMSNNT